jgi:apolipoprotein N-acyltransferase
LKEPAPAVEGKTQSYLLQTGLTLLSAALLVLAFPDHNRWYLAWPAFALILYVLSERLSVRRAFLLGELFGACFFYGSCYWITYSMIHYGGLAPPVAYCVALIPVLVSALFPAAFAALLVRLMQSFGARAILVAPLLWVAFEYLRLHITGMGWNSLGYVLGFHPELLWPARYGGVYLVSAIVVLPGAAIVLAIRRRERISIALAVASIICLAGVYLAGMETKASAETGDAALDVVAIQAVVPVGDVAVEIMQDGLKRHFDMTRDNLPAANERKRPVLVVWPETPFGFEIDRDQEWQRVFGDFTRYHQIYLLLNASTGENTKSNYNSVVVFGPAGGNVGQYDKIHLLPFGEYVPLRDYLPFINRIPALAGEFKAGNKYTVLQIEGVTIGTSICFESVFPDISREMARAGASAFINIADDAWFGPTPIARQHLAHVAMRAAETGLPVLRVTNTGITAQIAPDGRVSGETPLFETATRKWQLPARKPALTFYVRYGDLFAILSLVGTIVLLIASRASRGRENHKDTKTEK